MEVCVCVCVFVSRYLLLLSTKIFSLLTKRGHVCKVGPFLLVSKNLKVPLRVKVKGGQIEATCCPVNCLIRLAENSQ